MAALPALRDLTFDSAGTIVTIVLGLQRVPVTKFTPPKVDIKTDKPPIVGEMLPTKRTPGKAEIGDGNFEMLLEHWTDIVLPALGYHGGTLITVPILMSVSHPSMSVKYSALFDECRFVGDEGPEVDGSEKALIKKGTVSCMNKYEQRNKDGWKCLAYDQRKPSSAAAALMGWAK